MNRAPQLGDVLVDLDSHEWYFNGTVWDDFGQLHIGLATSTSDGLITKDQYVKLSALDSKSVLDTRFGSINTQLYNDQLRMMDIELNSNRIEDKFDDITNDLIVEDGNLNDAINEINNNKAIDFSVVNDTKYPTTKAVDDKYANKTQEAWITPTLINGTTGSIKYMKDTLGFVHFKGSITTAIPAFSDNVMLLPIGYRPLNTDSFFPVIKDDGITVSSTLVSNNGGVLCGLQGKLYLDGIIYKAEA